MVLRPTIKTKERTKTEAMYKIVIFSGGTGSIPLQQGLHQLCGDRVKIDIVINGYDDGRSTGVCRGVFDDAVLGASDLRKNHMTRFALIHQAKLAAGDPRATALYDLFTARIDAASKEEAWQTIHDMIGQRSSILGQETAQTLAALARLFFFEDAAVGRWRARLADASLSDLSVANVFYTASAVQNSHSLRLAGLQMSRLLGIPDCVHLISDVALYLGARTQSGRVIDRESRIVSWDQEDDRITSIHLQKNGLEYIPSVDEGLDLILVPSVKRLVRDADLILFSAGTQWSSLIPTYMHSGFRSMLAASTAARYLVMNNAEDADMKGVSAREMVELLGRYLTLDGMTVVLDADASPRLREVEGLRSISAHLSGGRKNHDPQRLATLILQDFLGLPDGELHCVFDLDGTLWDERAGKPGRLWVKRTSTASTASFCRGIPTSMSAMSFVTTTRERRRSTCTLILGT